MVQHLGVQMINTIEHSYTWNNHKLWKNSGLRKIEKINYKKRDFEGNESL